MPKTGYFDEPELPDLSFFFFFFFDEELSELEDDSDLELPEDSGAELFLA